MPTLVENQKPKVELSPLGFPSQLIGTGENSESVSERIESVVLRPQPRIWWTAFGISSLLLLGFVIAVANLFYRGVGIWGINIPVAWGFAIVNFVWWIGIGHAGTFISAILLLLNQHWRTSINRLTEAMTLFAVTCAGLFPLLHLGRPEVFYWMLPYPDTMGLWPQFRSPLVWDIFAVTTYFTVSLMFWYLGLIPDLAALRDRAQSRWQQKIYGIFALGWRGSAMHWNRQQTAYLLLAGVSTPLVLSVHSVVSFDFAFSLVPGWHTTIFPPYFVAGAIYSGFAMVLNIILPLRKIYGLYGLITPRHLNNMASIMLATGLIVAYGYLMEHFMAWQSGNIYEQSLFLTRALGPYAWSYWSLLVLNVLVPQVLWSRRVRTNPILLFGVALIINIGMWLERFVIVIISLHRDYLPSSWGMYYPTFWDILTFAGTIGLFLTLMLLFIRFVPMIALSEMRELVAHENK